LISCSAARLSKERIGGRQEALRVAIVPQSQKAKTDLVFTACLQDVQFLF